MSNTPSNQTTTLTKAQAFYDATFDAETRSLLDQAEAGDFEAMSVLDEMGYTVTKDVTYYVTLASSGPAARLVVQPDEDGGIQDAWLEYRNWSSPWTPAPKQDAALVRRLASFVGPYDF